MAKVSADNFAVENESSGAHPEREIIGKFFTGELTKRQSRTLTKHLAACEQCRKELAEHVRLARAEVSADEIQRFEAAPRRTIDEHVRHIVRQAPATPGAATFNARRVLNWLDEILASPILAPAAALGLVVMITLAGVQGNKTYQQRRLATELSQGFTILKSEWFITSEDLRPAGGFASSAFSRPRSKTPIADSNAAVQSFRKALQRDPDNREAQLGLAIFHYFSGQMFFADSLLRILLARDSTDAEAWNQYGLVQARLGNAEQALLACEAALRYQPQYAEAAFNRAQLLTQLQRKADALQAWQDYLRRDATSPWAEAARARINFLAAP